MKILVIDNYDSFTYNLVHCVKKFSDAAVDVFRNDQISIEAAGNYDKIIISPGPGLPADAGIILPLIKRYASSRSIMGVCLGMQAVTEAFGGTLLNPGTVYHGISLPVNIKVRDVIFDGIPDRFMAGRYHSWAADTTSLPSCFDIIAEDNNGIIMALSHKTFDVKGVQFHPESILTEYGDLLVRNWIRS